MNPAGRPWERSWFSNAPKGLVERTLDKLQSEGYVTVVQKDMKSGRPMSVLALTEKGKSLLGASK